jgi:hypothetical protein
MKGAALASFLIVVMVLAVFSAPALAQVRGGVGFHGGGGHFGGYYGGHFRGYYGVGFYGGFYGGPWWPLWWPYYAAPVYYGYYGAYDPYYAYPPDPPSTAVAPQRAPATQCYAPKVDQSGKVVPMPDYSKPVPCPSTQ